MGNALESSAEIQPTRQQLNSKRILVVLVCLQFLAAPVTLVQDLMPVVIGVGSFSTSVDLRYANAFLLGISFALPVFLAFAFAWSSYSLPKRICFLLPFLIAVVAISVSSILIREFWSGWRRFPFRECFMMIGALTHFIAGMVIIPLAFRAYRGWVVARMGIDRTISRTESSFEWLTLAAIAMLIYFSGSFDDPAFGMSFLSALVGVVLGGAVSFLVFWMLRDLKSGFFWGLFVASAIPLLGLPSACIVLAISRRVQQLMGFEFVCLGIASGITVLFLQVLLVRQMGCRMQKFGFDKSKVPVVEKLVVDPFSD